MFAAVGGGSQAALQAAYALAELMGVRFNLANDVLPVSEPSAAVSGDASAPSSSSSSAVCALLCRMHSKTHAFPRRAELDAAGEPMHTSWVRVSPTPQATLRGLQPFHDFSEGPDWSVS